jgi:hypothetical protein
MKDNLIYQMSGIVITEWGHEIYLEMKLWQYSDKQSTDFPEGYKFNWIAFNLINPDKEFVLFDNHHDKPPHYHVDNKKEWAFFTWVSRQETEKLFFQKVQQRFGYFALNWE